MSDIFNYLLTSVIEFLEYPAWIIRYLAEHFLGQCVAVFAITLVLQKMRCSMRTDRYASLWKILLGVSLVWGGIALFMYIPNFIDWYKEYLFLPSVFLAVVLAKLQLRLRTRWYLLLLAVLAGVVALAYAIVNPSFVRTNSYSKVNNTVAADGMFEIHRWLTDQPISEHEGGGGGGGMLGILGSSGFADWYWILFYSHGVLLLAGVVAVPPRRMCTDVTHQIDINGGKKAAAKADESG